MFNGVVAFHHIVHNLHCYLGRRAELYLLWAPVSDRCMDAVCHVSELRPEDLQLNCWSCVHSLDKNTFYTAKEMNFVSCLPSSCCIFNCEIYPNTAHHAPSVFGFTSEHLRPKKIFL